MARGRRRRGRRGCDRREPLHRGRGEQGGLQLLRGPVVGVEGQQLVERGQRAVPVVPGEARASQREPGRVDPGPGGDEGHEDRVGLGRRLAADRRGHGGEGDPGIVARGPTGHPPAEERGLLRAPVETVVDRERPEHVWIVGGLDEEHAQFLQGLLAEETGLPQAGLAVRGGGRPFAELGCLEEPGQRARRVRAPVGRVAPKGLRHRRGGAGEPAGVSRRRQGEDLSRESLGVGNRAAERQDQQRRGGCQAGHRTGLRPGSAPVKAARLDRGPSRGGSGAGKTQERPARVVAAWVVLLAL